MKNSKKSKLLSLVLAGILVLGMTACGNKPEPVVSEPEEEAPIASTVFMNPLAPPEGTELVYDIPNLLPKIAEADSRNSDTVGWIQIPNTTIDDVVVYYDDSASSQRNSYYLRKNFEKRYSFDGIYFGDYRCTFDGTAPGLQRNTVIYGHSMTDDYNGKLLNQLKKYDNRLNPEGEQFAKDNPYIFFSLEKENRAWEIFAIFDATVNLPYNKPTANDQEFADIISEAQKRSIYVYDTEVTAQDKILTISTCTYKYDKNYPNNYRYVVMAKLVEDGAPLKQTTTFTVNPEPKAP